MFYHAHRIDGTIISHSHPYWPESSANDEPFKKHSHSKGELTFVKYLNHLIWESGTYELFVSAPSVQSIECTSSTFVVHWGTTPLSLPPLRAPPV
ncbi:hypothetical protein [Mangrovibacterium diazotrophicum]|nr:hypothetical protein [Mangrovibacterium diazotrophicum]